MDESNEKSVSNVESTECGAPDFFGPSLPPHYYKKSEDKKIYGPIVPPNFRKKDESEIPSSDGKDKTLIGPDLPEYLKHSNGTAVEIEEETSVASDDDCFGPSTTLMTSGDVTGYYACMKAQIKKKESTTELSTERETWMTELPEKKMASLGLTKRHFNTRIQTEKERDSSVWTDTPADKKRKKKNEKDTKDILKMKRLKERDKEMEKLAKKMAKKMRKKESLLEIHQKNMKKKQKEKQSKKTETLPERRPFDRNIDLQVRKLDDQQKRAILNKSQFLNNRFAPGESKFL